MLLSNDWVNNKIKEEIRRYFETNANEDTTIQNLWGTGKAVLTGKFIALKASQKKKKKKKSSKCKFTLKGTCKRTINKAQSTNKQNRV